MESCHSDCTLADINCCTASGFWQTAARGNGASDADWLNCRNIHIGEPKAMSANRDEQDILAVIQEESAAYFRRDFDALSECWLQSEEARRICAGTDTGTRTQTGWENISAGFKEAISVAERAYDIDEWLDRQNIQISVSGDMAWVHYDQKLFQHDPHFWAAALQHEIKILHRVQGRWQIACMIVISPDLPDDTVPQIRIDRDLKVVGVNKLATARVADHEGLLLVGDRLRARKSDFDPGLQDRISGLASMLRSSLTTSMINRDLKPVPLGEDDFGKPIYCWVFAEQDCVVVTFEDHLNSDHRLDLAKEVFHLSPSQRTLLGELAAGASLTEAASAMNVTVNTVRTHLRRMFEKTGTGDQAELLSAALKIEPPTKVTYDRRRLKLTASQGHKDRA